MGEGLEQANPHAFDHPSHIAIIEGLSRSVVGWRVDPTFSRLQDLDDPVYDAPVVNPFLAHLSKYDPLIDAPLDNSNGSLKLNPGPGLGIEMNREFLEANVVE